MARYGSSMPFLLPDAPITTLDTYRAAGGGAGLRAAHRLGGREVIEIIDASRLRGRGGGGFPTAIKWERLANDPSPTRYLVCNAAEGEPGTFKDRWLIRSNPYQLLEGITVAAMAVGASSAYIGIKARFTAEIRALELAAADMSGAGLLEPTTVTIVPGPDDYLFGEEKALLEVIEGRDPLPRLNPPYVQGLFQQGGGIAGPAVVNNVETLCNVPHIVTRGAAWFRSQGTEDTPGTMVFTIGGDVRRQAVVEMEMGVPLSFLIYGPGNGLPAGRRPMLVGSGVSNRPLSSAQLDTPLNFGSMRAVGSGLGSGGFTVYDDTACVVQVAAGISEFLQRSSCGQCPPCNLGTQAIADAFGALAAGGSGSSELDRIAA